MFDGGDDITFRGEILRQPGHGSRRVAIAMGDHDQGVACPSGSGRSIANSNAGHRKPGWWRGWLGREAAVIDLPRSIGWHTGGVPDIHG